MRSALYHTVALLYMHLCRLHSVTPGALPQPLASAAVPIG